MCRHVCMSVSVCVHVSGYVCVCLCPCLCMCVCMWMYVWITLLSYNLCNINTTCSMCMIVDHAWFFWIGHWSMICQSICTLVFLLTAFGTLWYNTSFVCTHADTGINKPAGPSSYKMTAQGLGWSLVEEQRTWAQSSTPNPRVWRAYKIRYGTWYLNKRYWFV